MSAKAQAVPISDLIELSDTPWPANEIEELSACPVCTSHERSLLHEDLIDNVFYCAPGRWTSWRCHSCGVAYIDPRPSPASIGRAYGTYYTHHEPPPHRSAYETLGPFRKMRRRLLNGYTNWRFGSRETPAMGLGFFALLLARPFKVKVDREYRHLPRPPENGGSLLDIGCGNGSFLRIASACGWDATGVDIDSNAVESATAGGARALQGGIERFDGGEELFDVITLNHVIEHVHDPLSLLRACHRLLKVGGQLWLETPNIDSLGHKKYGRHWRGLEPPRHLVLFNSNALKLTLDRAGFIGLVTKATPSPLLSISTASELIKRGANLGADIQFPATQLWAIRRDVLIEALTPSRREFLTVVAFRGA